MALYAQAISSGMSSLEILATGSNAQTRQAYNEAYATAAKKAGILEARQTSQQNIAAIEQDRVLSNTQVQLQQNQAEAMAIVNAAAAGVEGEAVDDVIYDTERNEVFAKSRNNRSAEQKTESQLAAIGSQTSALLAVPEEPKISYVGELIGTFGKTIDKQDIKNFEAYWSK